MAAQGNMAPLLANAAAYWQSYLPERFKPRLWSSYTRESMQTGADAFIADELRPSYVAVSALATNARPADIASGKAAQDRPLELPRLPPRQDGGMRRRRRSMRAAERNEEGDCQNATSRATRSLLGQRPGAFNSAGPRSHSAPASRADRSYSTPAPRFHAGSGH